MVKEITKGHRIVKDKDTWQPYNNSSGNNDDASNVIGNSYFNAHYHFL
jgi:hypothetical protein